MGQAQGNLMRVQGGSGGVGKARRAELLEMNCCGSGEYMPKADLDLVCAPAFHTLALAVGEEYSVNHCCPDFSKYVIHQTEHSLLTISLSDFLGLQTSGLYNTQKAVYSKVNLGLFFLLLHLYLGQPLPFFIPYYAQK